MRNFFRNQHKAARMETLSYEALFDDAHDALYELDGAKLARTLLRLKDVLPADREDEWLWDAYDGKPFLELAAEFGSAEVVEALLEIEGMQVDLQGRDEETALGSATYHGRKSVMHLLLSRGASPNGGTYGYLPLHLAAEKLRVDILDILLANGADPNVMTSHRPGMTDYYHTDIVSETPLMMVCSQQINGNFDPLSLYLQEQCAIMLIKAGALPNFWNSDGVDALELAIKNQPRLCRMLMIAGAELSCATVALLRKEPEAYAACLEGARWRANELSPVLADTSIKDALAASCYSSASDPPHRGRWRSKILQVSAAAASVASDHGRFGIISQLVDAACACAAARAAKHAALFAAEECFGLLRDPFLSEEATTPTVTTIRFALAAARFSECQRYSELLASEERAALSEVSIALINTNSTVRTLETLERE